MEIITYNVCYGETEPQPVIETSVSKITNEGIRSVTRGESKYTEWYVAKVTTFIDEQKIIALDNVAEEHDVLLAGIIEGTIDTTTKARLYARLIHEGKKSYPTDIPADIVQETYNQYTNYYKFKPDLVPPNEE